MEPGYKNKKHLKYIRKECWGAHLGFLYQSCQINILDKSFLGQFFILELEEGGKWKKDLSRLTKFF